MTKEKMQIIEEMIKGKALCVMATSDGNIPHTSLMNFFADHAVMKFYFLSLKTSKKNKNLKKNPHVSLLIDRRDEDLALSIEGVYSPIKKKQTIEAIIKLFLLKNPHMKQFAQHAEVELLRIEGKSGQLVSGFGDVFSTKFKNF